MASQIDIYLSLSVMFVFSGNIGRIVQSDGEKCDTGTVEIPQEAEIEVEIETMTDTMYVAQT